MQDRQNPTQQISTNPVIGSPTSAAQPDKPLTNNQLLWIDYCALGGLMTDFDGSHKQTDGTSRNMTVTEFAELIGVHRDTLYAWRKSIPNFWQLVGVRCAQLFSEARTIKVINSIYVNATVKLNPSAQALWMANQKLIDFRMPQQEIKHEAGNSWQALLDKKRAGVIEGEVVDEYTPSSNSA